MKVVVTGVASDFGTAMLPTLLADGEINEIVGIDIRPARVNDPKLRFVCEDVRSERLAELFTDADAVIHLAFLIQETKNKELTFDVNLNGSKNVIHSADKAGVKRLIIASSVSAYGSHDDYPIPVDESVFPRGNFNKYYYNNKAEVEHYTQWWVDQNPDSKLEIVLLRPPTVVGPDIENDIVKLLTSPIATFPTDITPFQLLHQDDLTDAFHRALSSEIVGPVNLGTNDYLDVQEMADIHGQRLIQRSVKFFSLAADIGFKLGLSPASSQWVTKGDPISSNRRAKKELGWQPKFSTEECAYINLYQHGRPILNGQAARVLARSEVAEAALAATTSRLKSWVEEVPAIKAALAEPEQIDRYAERVEHVFIPYKGTNVHMEVQQCDDSSAPTIVFSSGLGAYARFYLPFLGKLCDQGFNVVALDRPGHGLSEGRRGYASIEAILDTVEEAIRYARENFDGPVILAGSSLGGIITWLTLTRQPDIDAAVCHSIGHPDVYHEPAMKLKVPLLKSLAKAAPNAPIPVKQLADWEASSSEPAILESILNREDALWAWTAPAKAVAGLFTYRPPTEWSQLKTPVLVLVGDQDKMVTREFTENVLAVAKPENAELRVLEGMGHSIFHDHLDQTIDIFSDYVRAQSAQSADRVSNAP